MTLSRALLALLLAGRLAQWLASEDGDVRAGIQAYEAEQWDEALARFDQAIARRGDRPELHYDRGLALLAKGERDEARSAFERGTESERDDVRSSSFYELGNLALDGEEWEAAIAAYIECLKVRPDHDKAKWNLELALRKKQEQEKKEQEQEQQEQEQQDDQDQDQQDQQDQDQGTGGEPDQDQGTGGEPDQDQGTGGQDQEQDQGTGGEPDQEQGTGGEQDREQDQGTGGEPDDQQQQGGGDEESREQQDQQDQQSSGQPPSGGQEQGAKARPIERAEIDRALEELDQEDGFVFGRPKGSRPPAQDW